MPTLNNATKSPKTTIAGALIAIITISAVLSQQGIYFGHVGTGTVIGLISALATAGLGIIAKDPGN